jgi:hypothetical protein
MMPKKAERGVIDEDQRKRGTDEIYEGAEHSGRRRSAARRFS